MQTEFNFDEDDDTRNALLSPPSRSAAADFVPIGELAQAVILKLASKYPRIRCGRPERGGSDRPR